MPADTRFLIVRADDAGSACDANQAIRAALRAGAITAVGFMVPGPAFGDAVRVLRNELAQVDIGLHATVNSEWDQVRWGPVLGAAKVPSLVDEQGCFTRNPRDLKQRLVLTELVAEIAAQLAMLRGSGLSPHYLDTHMGFDWLPGVEPVLAAFAKAEGLRFVARTPAYLPGATEIAPNDLVTSWVERALSAPPGTYQLFTHPGRDDVEMRLFQHPGLAPGQIARERAAETAALCASSFRQGLAAAGVQLVRFTSPLR